MDRRIIRLNTDQGDLMDPDEVERLANFLSEDQIIDLNRYLDKAHNLEDWCQRVTDWFRARYNSLPH